MSEDIDIDTWLMGQAPSGRKVGGSDKPKNWIGDVSDGMTIREDRLQLARSRWTEARPEEFEIDGRVWRDRSTGREYVRVHGNALLSSESEVVLFAVHGGKIVCLRPANERVESRNVGTMSGRRATGRERTQ